MRIIITILILCGIGSAYAQKDLINKVTEQAVEIDSLMKVSKNYKQSDNKNRAKLLRNQDTINVMKSELSEFENVKAEKNNLEKQLKLKSDSLTILKSNLLDKDNQLTTQSQINKQEVREASEASKSEIIKIIVAFYNSKPFDDLLQSSSEQSIRNDRKIIGNTSDIDPLLSDLKKCLSARKLLESKFDEAKFKYTQIQLNQIKRESESLSSLINTIENYQTYNEGLKGAIAEIIGLDGRESVIGMPKEIQNEKFNKIIVEISDYIFNYEFNFLDYPYLSDVVLEIIKRKAPNPDADISDLAQKL
jgi:hypothetical protein